MTLSVAVYNFMSPRLLGVGIHACLQSKKEETFILSVEFILVTFNSPEVLWVFEIFCFVITLHSMRLGLLKILIDSGVRVAIHLKIRDKLTLRKIASEFLP